MESKTRTPNGTSPVAEEELDLWKLEEKVRGLLRKGVKLEDGRVVGVKMHNDVFTYARMLDGQLKVDYVDGCANVFVKAIVSSGNVKIEDVAVVNLCSGEYDI